MNRFRRRASLWPAVLAVLVVIWILILAVLIYRGPRLPAWPASAAAPAAGQVVDIDAANPHPTPPSRCSPATSASRSPETCCTT